MTILEVPVQTYYDAADICARVAADWFNAFKTAMSSFGDTTLMSGSVGEGKEWGESYDERAQAAYSMSIDLVVAADNYARILRRAGYNMALADYDPKSGQPQPTAPNLNPSFTLSPQELTDLLVPPSVGGPGRGLVDDGLELAAKIGVPIPDGNTEKLESSADVWNNIATNGSVTGAAGELERAAAMFVHVQAPEVNFLDEDLRVLKTTAENLVATYQDLSRSCMSQKKALEDLRAELRKTLVDLATALAVEIGIKIAVGVVASCVTFGAGAAVMAASTAKTIDRFVDLLRVVLNSRKLHKTVEATKDTEQTRAELQRLANLFQKRMDDLEVAAKKAKEKIDDSIKSLRPHEQATVARLAEDPRFAGRTFKAPPPPDPGYDWYDDLGRHYDALGDGSNSQHFKLDQFTNSIDKHLLKSNDFTVIDMTGYTPQQIADVSKYVNSLPPASQEKIIRVGF
ncbi:hypothetical protein FEK35_30845 [Nocardia cyriacigeorgica]|uniref:WXG100 family type VII secretion target n=1 Tax=Nocardia cyriacigeorgica TaxID=135487 RepID=A0A5R8P575_9NOCA|nr:hypothetical protein [Nocardia cyriacigeorgica]TLF92277.1 hypothetical protein FEK35_30845 [Nocardia cyriacigeorgica]